MAFQGTKGIGTKLLTGNKILV